MIGTTNHFATGRKATLLYDGNCELCKRSVRLLKRLDTNERIRFADARDEAQWPASDVELNRERMLEAMHLVTPGGREVYAGFDAFRWVCARVPLLWGVYPFLHLPGVPTLGRKLYAWIAKNRFELVPCHHGACELPALRKAG